MDRFFHILDEEIDKALSGPGITWNKKGFMTVFHKCFAIAVTKYAKEKGIDLT
jgi:hypothetical protein